MQFGCIRSINRNICTTKMHGHTSHTKYVLYRIELLSIPYDVTKPNHNVCTSLKMTTGVE